MSIVRTIGKGVAWNTASTIVGKVVIFANIFLMLRYLSVYEYGLGQLVLSVVATLGIFLLPGLSGSILADMVVERARGEFGKMKSLFVRFSVLSVVLGGIAWGILFFGSDIAAHLSGNDTVGYLLKIASFSLLITPFRVISTTLAAVELRYFDQAFYGFFEELVKFVSLVFFLLGVHIGLSGMFYAIVISQFVAVLAYVPRSLSAYRVFGHSPVTETHAFWRIILDHRKWSIANSYIGNLGQTLFLWLIRLLLGTEAVGLYAFAQGIYGQVASFLPLGNVLAPLLPRYTDQRDVFARYVRSAVKAQSLFAIPLIVATFVGLPVLVLIFPKYQLASPLVMIMIFTLIPASIANLYIPAFAALKEQYGYFWSSVWRILLIPLLVPLPMILWGTQGIGVGMILVSTASVIERTWRLRRALPEYTFGFRDLLTFDSYERALLIQLVERWRKLRQRNQGR